MTHMHSHAHVSEVGYSAVRHALFPAGFPHKRDANGRFVSRIKSTAQRLRAELQAQANMPLGEAIEAIRATEQRGREAGNGEEGFAKAVKAWCVGWSQAGEGDAVSFRSEQLAEGVTLYLGDMQTILQDLPVFDAIVTDPPYGIGESSAKVASRGKLAAPKDYGDFDWDKEPASAAQIDLIRARSRSQIIFGGNYFELGPTSCWLVWDKQNGDNDFADCELAWTNLPKAVRRIYWRWNGMIRKGQEERFHPTQKPEGVMAWTLTHVPDAKTICDPFMGSGTTGVAAVKAGRQFVGIERDERYFDVACKRIAAALTEPDMFIETPTPLKQTSFLDPDAA